MSQTHCQDLGEKAEEDIVQGLLMLRVQIHGLRGEQVMGAGWSG